MNLINDSAVLSCKLAADLIHKGQYEAAREALGWLWRGIGKRPDVKGLPLATVAEVLLQCGTLTGWLGSAQNVPDAQEKAKDLLFEALRKFKSQGQVSKVSEAQYELGMCYWRLGQYDESRVVMQEALTALTDADIELKAKILIRRTIVEVWENRYYEALGILKEAEPVFESANDALRGRWHGQKGLVLIRLARVERNDDYADRALIEFTAAIYHYEQAGHERYCATNLNNLAMTFLCLGRYTDAHNSLDRAHRIFTRLKDPGNLAQVDETRARVLVAERKYTEANRVIAGVIQTFEQGGEAALLTDALTVQGLVRAKLGESENSINILKHAVKAGQDSGAHVSAGLAALTLIEEHGARRLSEAELINTYLRADELLTETQDTEDITRLRACARLILRRLLGLHSRGKNFVLGKAVRAFEARFIEEALAEAGGSVTNAARLLGIRYQSLALILQNRHRRLLPKRTPAKSRKRSIIKGD